MFDLFAWEADSGNSKDTFPGILTGMYSCRTLRELTAKVTKDGSRVTNVLRDSAKNKCLVGDITPLGKGTLDNGRTQTTEECYCCILLSTEILSDLHVEAKHFSCVFLLTGICSNIRIHAI